MTRSPLVALALLAATAAALVGATPLTTPNPITASSNSTAGADAEPLAVAESRQAATATGTAAGSAQLHSLLMQSLSLPEGKRRLDDISTAASNTPLSASRAELDALLAGGRKRARKDAARQLALAEVAQQQFAAAASVKHATKRGGKRGKSTLDTDLLAAFPSNTRSRGKPASSKRRSPRPARANSLDDGDDEKSGSPGAGDDVDDDDAGKGGDADSDSNDDDDGPAGGKRAEARSASDGDSSDGEIYAPSANDRFFQDDDAPSTRNSRAGGLYQGAALGSPLNAADAAGLGGGQRAFAGADAESSSNGAEDSDSDGDSDAFASRSDDTAATAEKQLLRSLAAVGSSGKAARRANLKSTAAETAIADVDADEYAGEGLPASKFSRGDKSATAIGDSSTDATEADDADSEASNALPLATVAAPSQQLSNVRDSSADLATAAGHHHKHGGHYYQHVEVPKKKAWKFGFKRGNHKHEIARHEKGYKHKFHSEFHWHAKEKCKKKKKCKSVGSMKWEYKHAKKHHHG